jgi:hypothetical protein
MTWTQSSSFCSLWKVKQLCQISLYLTRKSALYSSIVVRRIFCFLLVLAIDASTGFFTYSFDANSWLTLFHIEKVFKDWSFSSVIKTSFLFCSCFFLLLVEVGGLLLEGGGREEGREDEEGRFFLSLSA